MKLSPSISIEADTLSLHRLSYSENVRSAPDKVSAAAGTTMIKQPTHLVDTFFSRL